MTNYMWKRNTSVYKWSRCEQFSAESLFNLKAENIYYIIIFLQKTPTENSAKSYHTNDLCTKLLFPERNYNQVPVQLCLINQVWSITESSKSVFLKTWGENGRSPNVLMQKVVSNITFELLMIDVQQSEILR